MLKDEILCKAEEIDHYYNMLDFWLQHDESIYYFKIEEEKINLMQYKMRTEEKTLV